MKKLLTGILIICNLSVFGQKDTTVTDTAYVVNVMEDIKKADDLVYGKITKEQYQLIQQYNALIQQIVMQRKKKLKKP